MGRRCTQTCAQHHLNGTELRSLSFLKSTHVATIHFVMASTVSQPQGLGSFWIEQAWLRSPRLVYRSPRLIDSFWNSEPAGSRYYWKISCQLLHLFHN